MIQPQENYGAGQVTCSNCLGYMPSSARYCPHCGTAADLTSGSTGPTIDQPQVEYMGFWIRVAAAVIDGLITTLVSSLISAAVGVPAVGTIFSVLYYVLFIGLKGQTPGKMALRIQIVDA